MSLFAKVLIVPIQHKKILTITVGFFLFIIGLRTVITRHHPIIFIGLMNSNEAKPFGGFFGSFAIIRCKPRSISLSLHDSYEPGIRTDYRHPLPDYYRIIMPYGDGKIGMLGANMLGRTADDTQTIRSVYYHSYHEELDRVILVSSHIFSFLLPDWQQTMRERQFLNATVDIRRGLITGNKKSDSFEMMKKHLEGRDLWLSIGYHGLRALTSGKRNGLIHIDPPSSYHRLIPRLQNKQRYWSYKANTLYRGWYNISFNKIDERTRTITHLQGPNGKIQTNNRSLPISGSGHYIVTQTSTISIPPHYIQAINMLTKKHNIMLTAREKTILALLPTFHRRVVFYLPLTSSNITTQGLLNTSIYTSKNFTLVIGESAGMIPSNILITFDLE